MIRFRLWPVLVIIGAAVAFTLSTEPVFGSIWRFRIIMLTILGQSLLLYWVLLKMFKQQDLLMAQRGPSIPLRSRRSSERR